MIRTNREYEITQQRLKENRAAIDETRTYLQAEGFNSDEIETLLESLDAIGRQLLDEVEEYDRARAGQLQPCSFQTLERLLIGGRIARGLTQEQFAALLGYNDSSTVSRDESNDYRGAKRERIQRALDKLGIDAIVTPRLRDASQAAGWQELLIGHATEVMAQASPVTVAAAAAQPSTTAVAQSSPVGAAQSLPVQVDVSLQSVAEGAGQGELIFQWPESNYAVGYITSNGVQPAAVKDAVTVSSGAWTA